MAKHSPTESFAGTAANWLRQCSWKPIERLSRISLRKVGARTFTELFNALEDICRMLTTEECWNYFQAARYAAG
jgi:hypothetical protein